MTHPPAQASFTRPTLLSSGARGGAVAQCTGQGEESLEDSAGDGTATARAHGACDGTRNRARDDTPGGVLGGNDDAIAGVDPQEHGRGRTRGGGVLVVDDGSGDEAHLVSGLAQLVGQIRVLVLHEQVGAHAPDSAPRVGVDRARAAT